MVWVKTSCPPTFKPIWKTSEIWSRFWWGRTMKLGMNQGRICIFWAGLWIFGAELQSSGETVNPWGGHQEIWGKQKNGAKNKTLNAKQDQWSSKMDEAWQLANFWLFLFFFLQFWCPRSICEKWSLLLTFQSIDFMHTWCMCQDDDDWGLRASSVLKPIGGSI